MTSIKAYSRILKKIEDDQCVILDGAIATEIQRHNMAGFELSDDSHWGFDNADPRYDEIVTRFELSDDSHWGFDALHKAPNAVLDVHQQYLEAGADVLTTNTYSILDAPSYTGQYDTHIGKPIHWMELARKAIELPRSVIKNSQTNLTAAVGFSIGGEIETSDHRATLDLLLKIFKDTPPDFVLFETLSLIEDNFTQDAIKTVLDSGLPVWVSFRRCRRGVCGIHGQLWGGPEGDRFGRLAHSLELLGVDALLINCLPTYRIDDTLLWLRDFTKLPLGVYPNIGRFVESGWQFDKQIKAEDYSNMAMTWREDGAQIIGGCCGVGPTEIKLIAKSLKNKPRKVKESTTISKHKDVDNHQSKLPETTQWKDNLGRDLFPLPLPKIVVDEGVFVPTQGSYLIWKYLFTNNIGASESCLDIGCGVGILAIQLALNGAKDVTAVDILPEAVDNTLTNGFRNGVSGQLTGIAADLYSFIPERKFDVIVASLYQMPTNPKGQYKGHRDIDYWGRNLLDHFIKNLDNHLDESGAAYLMQVSMLGARRTEDLLIRHGYQYAVIDFNLYQFNPVFKENLEQIETVEKLSDAYHFKYKTGEHTMVMYLLKITKA